MSESQSDSKVMLRVNASDTLTEVFLVDNRFQLITAGVGSVEAAVAPGLYKARFRVGQVQSDSLVEVPAGTETKIFVGSAVQFATPVPLPQTMTWQQKHEEAARDLSKSLPLKKGSGSQLFLFLRGLTEEASRPWLGVSVHNLHGTLLAEAAQGTCDTENGYCGLHLELDPGIYRLRVEEEVGEIYEMFVITLAGWQTQLFALAEDAWLPGVQAIRAALPSAAVLTTEIGKGFDPDSTTARQTELLRIGLMSGRKILTKTGLQNLLAESPLDPISTLFAAHLLLRQENTNVQALAAALLDSMCSILSGYPDLSALLLHSQSENRTKSVFPTPPMLQASWQLIMLAVEKDQAEIPVDSLNGQIQQGAALNSALWLLHRLS